MTHFFAKNRSSARGGSTFGEKSATLPPPIGGRLPHRAPIGIKFYEGCLLHSEIATYRYKAAQDAQEKNKNKFGDKNQYAIGQEETIQIDFVDAEIFV